VHIPTLIQLAVILMTVVTFVMVAVWRANPQIPGVLTWALSFVSSMCVSVLFAAGTRIPFWLSVVGTQLGIFLIAYLALEGTRQYVGLRPLPWRVPATILAGLLFVSLYFSLVQPHLGARVLTASLLSGLTYLAAARVLVRGDLRLYPTRHIVAVIYLLHGLFLMVRPWLLHQTDATGPLAWQEVGMVQWALLESLIAIILLGFGSLMLVAEHINGELRRLAEKDGLTDIFNRRAFLTLFNKAASLAQRSRSDLPLLLVDLDHFKHINDTWGHGRGDEALRHFVQVARRCLRNEDLIGRMGGEEFAIFLPNARLVDARQVAERLREAVAVSPLLSPQGRVDLTVSIGVTLGVAGESVESILNRADRAMYLAKHRGRNRVEIEAEPQPA